MEVILRHLTKKFPSRDRKKGGEVIAVSDMDMTIPDGKLIGLLGPSGCGKSTALNLICGLETPTSGQIIFGDTDVTDLPPEQRGVGLVFQNYALYPHLTVRKNIMFPLENLKGRDRLSKEQMEERVAHVAGLVQIGHLLDRLPGEMSGGQQQRVAIARALAKLPRVLLLDEPLSNLDARLRLQTREELKRIQLETGITTVFVTHDQEEAMSISDLIVVMKEGVIQQTGLPQSIYDDPVNLFVAKFLGTPPVNVFTGQLRGGEVYIGDSRVMSLEGEAARDRKPDAVEEVYVAVRPEGFVPDDDGPLECGFRAIEVMGRDTSIVAEHPQLDTEQKQLRIIIPSETKVNHDDGRGRFSVKPSKTYVFRRDTQERIGGSRP